MKLQIIQDNKGKAAGVFIPIQEWNALKKQYKQLAFLEDDGSSKEKVLQEIRDAITELKLIELGKRKSRPAKELLNEL